MEVLTPPSPGYNTLKRPLDSDTQTQTTTHDQHHHQVSVLTPPDSSNAKMASYTSKGPDARESSPALSTSTLSSLPNSTAGSISNTTHPSAPGQPPRKRQKRTVEEKEKDRLEKEARTIEREQKRVLREAENTKKAEEKRVRDEERRHKNEEKEIKQREKDLQKKQKEAEEEKKQRAQSRLGNFFKVPAAKPKDAVSTERKRASSISESATTALPDQASTTTPAKATPSDYRTFFLPFSLPSHTTLSSTVLDRTSPEDSERAQEAFDQSVFGGNAPAREQNIRKALGLSRLPLRQGPRASALEAMQSLQELLQQPVDLTESASAAVNPAHEILRSIDMKHIHFSQDVRPPYTGSYTKLMRHKKVHKFARTPTAKIRPDTDYDYDSEAEWVEEDEDDKKGGEAEDLMSEDGDDAESLGSAGEMDDFLDDGENRDRVKVLAGELEPVSTGICWEDTKGCKTKAPAGTRMEWLLETVGTSINPFSTSYWTVPVIVEETDAAPATPPPSTQLDLFGQPVYSSSSSEMKPPRVPLQPTTNSGNQKAKARPIETAATAGDAKSKPAKPAAPQLTGHEFEVLKEAVTGQSTTKVELLKALKAKFPTWNYGSIKVTLEANFARIGAPSTEKTWRVMAG